MILRAIAIFAFLTPSILLGQSDTTATAPSALAAASSDPFNSEGVVYLDENFESFDVGAEPKIPMLQRVELVTVGDGGGKVGTGKVARFNDSDTDVGGAMEYNVGDSGASVLYIEFDAFNNDAGVGDKSSTIIFGVGPWAEGKSLVLNSKAKRAFGFEMYQQKYLKLRIGSDVVGQLKYDPAAAFNVKIWANDSDQKTFPYKRPDNGEAATLGVDSVVAWVNDSLIGDLAATGTPMNSAITSGDAGIGRIGFSSSSTKVADFLIDNLHVENPLGDSKPAASKATNELGPSKKSSPATNEESMFDTMPGAETMVYREGKNKMNLFVYKPEDWKADDRRSAFVFFFGGGWTKGTPEKSASIAKWAAKHGMVGIAPDYRTKDRFDTSPLASVDDGRAAFAWVLEHSKELGIDPARVAVGGSSAGGHVALWTAIEKTPPGSDPTTSPKSKPAAVYLTSAVTDTSPETGYTPKRFGDDATALSPVDQLDAKMPPMEIIHAANDPYVSYGSAVALYHKLVATGNSCELVTIPIGGHSFAKEYPKFKAKAMASLEAFFDREGLLPAVR